MSTVPARILAERAARRNKCDPVSEQDAAERVANDVATRRLMNEAVAAVAGVFRAAIAVSHRMHAVAEEPA